jgi:uncharacterized protein (DUF4415 family)
MQVLRFAAAAERRSLGRTRTRLVAHAYIHLYARGVRFAWDPRKSAENLRVRGFDFEFATLVFEGPRWSARTTAGITERSGSPPSGWPRASHSPLSTQIEPSPALWSVESSRPARAIAVSAKRTSKPSRKSEKPRRGRANLSRLRKATERTIRRSSPSELADLPADFFAGASVVHPTAKQPISLRVDEDVLKWFKAQGPRYQSRMNAVLRAYMAAIQRGAA